MVRLLLTVVSAAGTAALASAGGPVAATPAAPATPVGPDLWPDCGLEPVELGQGLTVNGAPTEASVAWTASAPAEVVACHKVYFESLPVDLAEMPADGGRILSVFDNRHGIERMVSARVVAGGSTEVVRGSRPLADRLAQVSEVPGLPLEPDLLALVSVQDGGAATVSGICARSDPVAPVTDAWRGAGWTVESVQPVPPGASAALRIRRGARTGLLVLTPAPCRFTLRIEGRP